VGQFRGRSVLAFRYAPLLSPPKPATAYALTLQARRLTTKSTATQRQFNSTTVLLSKPAPRTGRWFQIQFHQADKFSASLDSAGKNLFSAENLVTAEKYSSADNSGDWPARALFWLDGKFDLTATATEIRHPRKTR